MKSVQSIREDHFASINSNKSAAIAQVMELSTGTYPLLMAYFLHLRKQNAVHNKFDDKNETSQMIQEYNYACAHDLLFFLTVTQQFNLIRELFENNEKLALLMALINEIEREQKQAQAQNYVLIEENQKALLKEHAPPPKSQTQPNNEPLNALLMYQYYDALYNNITYKHHMALIDIYNDDYAGRMARMNAACNAALNNPSISLADKKKLLDLQREYHEEHEQIKRMPITHEDGSPNYEAAKKQAHLLQSLNEKYHKQWKNSVEDICSKPGTAPSLNSTLKELLKAEHEETQKTKERVVIQDEQYQKEVKEVSHLREASRQAVIEPVGGLIQNIQEIQMHQLPDEQHEEHIQSLSRLETIHKQLQQIDSPERQKELLSEFVGILNRVRKTVEPVMSAEKKQAFTNNLDLLNQLIKDTKVSQYYTAPHTKNTSVQEDISVSNEKKQAQRTENEVLAHEKPQKMSAINPHSLFARNTGTRIAMDSLSIVSQNVSYETIDLQRQIKIKMQENRLAKDVSPGTHDLTQPQKTLIESIGELKNQLDKAIIIDEFSEQDIQDYELISSLDEELTKDSCSKERYEQIVSEIQSATQRLSENHKSIAELKNNLETISQATRPNEERNEQYDRLRL